MAEYEEVSVDSLKPIQVGVGLDLSEHEGKRAKIETLKVIEYTSPWDENGMYVEGLKRKVKGLKVATGKVAEYDSKDKGIIDIFASELFNLKQDKDGSWGISSHEKAGIQRFMRRQKVSELKALIGTQVTLKVNTNKTGNSFLGFITE